MKGKQRFEYLISLNNLIRPIKKQSLTHLNTAEAGSNLVRCKVIRKYIVVRTRYLMGDKV